jgi:hypothetical protein
MRGNDLPLGRADRRGRQPRPRGTGAHPPARGSGSEGHALCLAADVASTGGAEDAEGDYGEALALAEPRGMRPLVAHCHLGLAMFYRATAQPESAKHHLATAATMFRDMEMRSWLEEATLR